MHFSVEGKDAKSATATGVRLDLNVITRYLADDLNYFKAQKLLFTLARF